MQMNNFDFKGFVIDLMLGQYLVEIFLKKFLLRCVFKTLVIHFFQKFLHCELYTLNNNYFMIE